jgi:hypothetical protein
MNHFNEDLISQIRGGSQRDSLFRAICAGRGLARRRQHPFAPTYRGPEEVFTALRSFEMAAEGSLQVCLVGVTANEKHALAIRHATGKLQPRRLRTSG